MELILVLLVVAAVFGLCYLVDKAFTKLFRGKAQHHSGLAVRVSKRYGVFGVILVCLGILAICSGIAGAEDQRWLMLLCGFVVMLMGAALAGYYLGFGVFYDEDTFLISRFGKKDRICPYSHIRGQRLYLIQGGSVVVELHLSDGTTLSLNSNMDGVYPFLDSAFDAWCRQTGRDPAQCPFHDPSQSLWFPSVEEV